VAGTDVIMVEALKELRGVDCSTPKCRANAFGTGRLLQRELLGKPYWTMEFHCPDCGDPMEVWAPSIQELADRLEGAVESEREAIARLWLAGRGGPKPWR